MPGGRNGKGLAMDVDRLRAETPGRSTASTSTTPAQH